jgi:hypothetical protein
MRGTIKPLQKTRLLAQRDHLVPTLRRALKNHLVPKLCLGTHSIGSSASIYLSRLAQKHEAELRRQCVRGLPARSRNTISAVSRAWDRVFFASHQILSRVSEKSRKSALAMGVKFSHRCLRDRTPVSLIEENSVTDNYVFATSGASSPGRSKTNNQQCIFPCQNLPRFPKPTWTNCASMVRCA